MRARISGPGRVTGFVPAIRALDRPIESNGRDRNPSAAGLSGRKWRGAAEPLDWAVGRGSSAAVFPFSFFISFMKWAVGRKLQAVGWPAQFQTKFFLCYFSFFFLSQACFSCFCLFFRQISSSFFYSKIIQRNFCLGNRKVKEMLLKRRKLI